MGKIRLALMLILLTLPGIACQLSSPVDNNAELTRIAGEVLATVTAQAVVEAPTSTNPPAHAPGVPYFEAVVFAEDVLDGSPVKAGTEFPSGTMQVCAINDFTGMKAELVISEVVYRSGIIWYHQVGNWEENREEGITSLCLWDEDGTALDPGDYLYEFYVGEELVSGGIFKVVP